MAFFKYIDQILPIIDHLPTPCCHIGKVCISLTLPVPTTYLLPSLVNDVVCERPLICNYNWLSALRPLQIQKHLLWSESCSSIKYKKNHRDLGKFVAFVERSPLRPVQWYDLFSHTRWTILTFDNHCTSSHSGLFGQDRSCSVFGPAAFWRVFQFFGAVWLCTLRRVRLSLCDLSSRTSVVTERLPVVHLKRKTIIHYTATYITNIYTIMWCEV